MDLSDLINKMIRAAKLDANLYEEVEADREALSQAITVVAIVAVASGIGGFLGALMAGNGFGSALGGLIVGIISAFIGWAIWSFLAYWIGTTFLGGTATYGELLRTLGFAFTPNILGFFSFIPCLGGLIALVGWFWALVAGVVAVRQALDFDTGKAIITVIIGWVIVLIISLVIGLFVAGAALLGGLVTGAMF